jgi:glycosyltransferase involved in cell wall biosynthesis
VRILLWHGYLLGGTGSNVYTRALAREWSRMGHEVVVVCQERHPELYDVGGAQVVAPGLPGGLLPVFVVDEYEGLRPKLLQEFSPAELDVYVDANAAALRDLLPADAVFTNHVLLGGAVGAALGVPFAVKVHGSELEYSMRGNERLSRWGAEVLAEAQAVYVGSAHIRGVLEDVVGHVERVHEVSPGVDVDEFTPASRDVALAALVDESRRDQVDRGERHPDSGNAERFAQFFSGGAPTILYFGKLIENKGVQVLFDAIHGLQLDGLDVRALIVGFGDYRDTLEAQAPPGTLFTGALEHRHLVHLLPLVDVAVVPSIFPEAFGMVAAEAAAAGVPPVVADHSGLAEVAAGIARAYPDDRKGLVSFPTGDAGALHERLRALLELPAAERRGLGLAARSAVERNWGWPRVAARLLEPFGD